MKFLNVPISVETRNRVPRRIRWGRRTYTVRRLLDFWILQTRWWASEEKRVYFRLETDGGVMEVYRGEEEKEGEGAEGGRRRSETLRREGGYGGGRGGESKHGSHQGPRGGGPLPFVEGDTHTRELRQTESPYRPDAAALAGRRLGGSDSARVKPDHQWILAKMID